MNIALTIGFSLALSPLALAGGDDDIKNAGTVVTTLTRLRETPEAYKHVRVTFTVWYGSIGRVSNPFFTRFVPSEYANFYTWATEQPIWRKDQYTNAFAYLFLSKRSSQLQELYDLSLYDQLQITGVVRNTFQNAPWIEVLEFSKLGESVSTESLSHLYRGEQLMDRRQWQRAVSELNLAHDAGVFQQMDVAVHRNLGICYLRMGSPGQAKKQLETAIELSEGRDPASTRLLMVAKSAPELELDRFVNPTELGDHQQPFWEIFQGIEWTEGPSALQGGR